MVMIILSTMSRQVLLQNATNQLKMISNEPSTVFYDLSFVYFKMSYYQLNRDRLLKETNDRYHNGGGREKATEHYKDNQQIIYEKMQEINIMTYLRKKRKYRELMEEINIEICQKKDKQRI